MVVLFDFTVRGVSTASVVSAAPAAQAVHDALAASPVSVASCASAALSLVTVCVAACAASAVLEDLNVFACRAKSVSSRETNGKSIGLVSFRLARPNARRA